MRQRGTPEASIKPVTKEWWPSRVSYNPLLWVLSLLAIPRLHKEAPHTSTGSWQIAHTPRSPPPAPSAFTASASLPAPTPPLAPVVECTTRYGWSTACQQRTYGEVG